MTTTLTEQGAVVRNYRELGSYPLQVKAKLESEEVKQGCIKSEHFIHMSSGEEGDKYERQYHHPNGLDMVVSQEYVSVPGTSGKSLGYQNRQFKFSGEISQIEATVRALEQNGVRLEQIK
jgi:hypothetical protein